MYIKYFCFQPVKLSNTIFQSLNQKKFTPSAVNWFDISALDDDENTITDFTQMDWLRELKIMHRTGLYVFKSDYSEFNSALIDINTMASFDDDLAIDNSSGSVLLYDSNYKVFYIVYSLILKTNKTLNPKRLSGLHDTIRNQLVIDDANGNFDISDWASSIRSKSLESIRQEFKGSSSDQDFTILNNSGYLCSLFPDFDQLNFDTEMVDFKNKFLNCNHNIDLVDEKKQHYSQLSINNTVADGNSSYENSKSIIFFGWRSTTLFGLHEDRDIKLIPLLINVQNIYIQIDCFYKPFLSSIYEEVQYSNDYVSLSEKLEYFDRLLISFQNLIYSKERFLSELKPFQAEVFSEVESYWGMSKTYSTIDNTLNICQTSLERKLDIKNNRIQQKQNDILFVLAIIQIFSIVGIVGDYFSLFSLDVSSLHDDELALSKQYIIYSLTILSVGLIAFAYMEKVWYSTKKIIRRSVVLLRR